MAAARGTGANARELAERRLVQRRARRPGWKGGAGGGAPSARWLAQQLSAPAVVTRSDLGTGLPGREAAPTHCPSEQRGGCSERGGCSGQEEAPAAVRSPARSMGARGPIAVRRSSWGVRLAVASSRMLTRGTHQNAW
jgi:hypothetical protein